MNHHLSHKKLLHIALSGALGSALTACCGGSFSGAALAPPPMCDIKNEIYDLSQLSATAPVEGMILIPADSEANTVTLGQPCMTATDVTQCQADLIATQEQLRNQPTDTLRILVTHADTTTLLDGQDAIKDFLGPLDNPQKIHLWLYVNGLENQCDTLVQVPDDYYWTATYTRRIYSGGDYDETITLRVEYDGAVTEESRSSTPVYSGSGGGACATPGRTPPGDLTFDTPQANLASAALGQLFAKFAAYEAASVDAFNHLKVELKHHGAPTLLLSKIDAAANDEVRHAKQVGELATFYGAEVECFSVDTGPIRDLKSIALDNLKEGCIGESWAALLGLHQGQHAQTLDIQNTMHSIAIDEIGHAALSWEIHAWLYAQFDAATQAWLDEEQTKALAALKAKIGQKPMQAHHLVAGLPSQAMAHALVDELETVFAA